MESDIDVLLREMEAYAEKYHVPILRSEERELFERIVREASPRRILEIGTGIGYSALLMLRSNPTANLISIERDPECRAKAVRFISHAGKRYASRAMLLDGAAEKLLPELSPCFDFVFIDAAKSRYPFFWQAIQPILTPRAVVVADNVLFRGLVDGEEWPKHSYRTMVLKLREYLRLVQAAPDFRTEIFPEGDGMAVSWRDA